MLGLAKFNYVSANNCFISSLLYHNLITIYSYTAEHLPLLATEFNGLSSPIARNGIIYSELKILAKL